VIVLVASSSSFSLLTGLKNWDMRREIREREREKKEEED
jgi:hypothetical protein